MQIRRSSSNQIRLDLIDLIDDDEAVLSANDSPPAKNTGRLWKRLAVDLNSHNMVVYVHGISFSMLRVNHMFTCRVCFFKIS